MRVSRYRSGKLYFPAGEEENTVVKCRSKFPVMVQKLAAKDNTEEAGVSEDVRHKNTWRPEKLRPNVCILMYRAENLFGESTRGPLDLETKNFSSSSYISSKIFHVSPTRLRRGRPFSFLSLVRILELITLPFAFQRPFYVQMQRI